MVFGASLSVSRRLLLSLPRLSSIRPTSMAFHESASQPQTLFHEVQSKETGKVRRLAYNKVAGTRTHGIIYIPGFMANKSGNKPAALHSFSQKHGFTYLRYDPSGLGESEGVKKTEAKYSLWLDDAKEMLLNKTDGPQIVICSSMGCWITCLLVQQYPEKFAGILMLAPAINFHHHYLKVLREQLPPKLLQKFEEGGPVPLSVQDYDEFILTKSHFTEMAKYELTREPEQIPVPVPLKIIHGIKDKDVPYGECIPLLHSIKSDNVQLTYLKYAGHKFHDDKSMEVIYDSILKLAAEVEPKAKL